MEENMHPLVLQVHPFTHSQLLFGQHQGREPGPHQRQARPGRLAPQAHHTSKYFFFDGHNLGGSRASRGRRIEGRRPRASSNGVIRAESGDGLLVSTLNLKIGTIIHHMRMIDSKMLERFERVLQPQQQSVSKKKKKAVTVLEESTDNSSSEQAKEEPHVHQLSHEREQVLEQVMEDSLDEGEQILQEDIQLPLGNEKPTDTITKAYFLKEKKKQLRPEARCNERKVFKLVVDISIINSKKSWAKANRIKKVGLSVQPLMQKLGASQPILSGSTAQMTVDGLIIKGGVEIEESRFFSFEKDSWPSSSSSAIVVEP
ncbi:hypothetical protein KSP40_PGU000241 [Platanthera guangdongensis]|uniref:Uncharacterized protein n=1 Tax=Platanthera guangdongensis TaxID=2320717 RepID=A0ABR2M9G0_9ASPA